MDPLNWHYADGQQSSGPVSFAQLHDLAARGVIQPSTLLWCEGMPQWVTADGVGLWSGMSRSSVEGAPITIGYDDASPVYAGFWRRVLAYIIDGIIIAVPSQILIAVTGPAFINVRLPTVGHHLKITPALTIANVLSLMVPWMYYALMESSATQATLGKMALGLYVTDLSVRPIDFGRATGRYFGMYLSALILCIGFFMAAFTERKQALHDVLAGALVLKRT